MYAKVNSANLTSCFARQRKIGGIWRSTPSTPASSLEFTLQHASSAALKGELQQRQPMRSIHSPAAECYSPKQYRNLSDRSRIRFPATAGLPLNRLPSFRSLVASSSNSGLAASTNIRPLRFRW